MYDPIFIMYPQLNPHKLLFAINAASYKSTENPVHLKIYID